jgi:hypothetical protein
MMIGKAAHIFTSAITWLTRNSAAKALAVALLISPVPLVATTSEAPAQVSFSVSFGYFHSVLAPYGHWYHHPRWGDVWRPTRVEIDFRPYHRGHWQYTHQFGWLWVSDYVWGDIPFHYGRWVYDPFDGWLWIPGYVWGPAWVIWRSGGGYTGWFPMPPDDGFLFGSDLFRSRWDNWDRGFGYYDWYGPSFGSSLFLSFWVFIDDRHFAERDYIRYVPPPRQYTRIINNTTNVTNYVTVNNYIVNRSVEVDRIERAAGRRIPASEPRDVVRRGAPITTVDVGRRLEERERMEHARDPNASPRARISSLPESRTRAVPPLVERQDGRADRGRELGRPDTERVMPDAQRQIVPPRDEHERAGAFIPPRERTLERSPGPQPVRPEARQQARPDVEQAPRGESRREPERPADRRREPAAGERSRAEKS